jgi:hypothetical protein
MLLRLRRRQMSRLRPSIQSATRPRQKGGLGLTLSAADCADSVAEDEAVVSVAGESEVSVLLALLVEVPLAVSLEAVSVLFAATGVASRSQDSAAAATLSP